MLVVRSSRRVVAVDAPRARTRLFGQRIAVAVIAALVIAACGSRDVLVVTERADQIPAAAPDDPFQPSDDPVDPADPADPADPSTTEPTEPTDPPNRNTTIEPADPMGEPDDPQIDPADIDPGAINFGENKPERTYDGFLLAALSDIDTWLRAEFEPVFGLPYQPLEGQVFAGYPERTSELPGCGEPVTSYQELRQFVAFYCPLGDFIVYDDDPDGLLGQLATQFGAATIGIVLAHEYGHAVQSRIGAFDNPLPTVTTEQQADCIAGAWAGRAAGGAAEGVPFDDDDIRAGLIAMIEVQDPVGTNPNEPGGHGSGFDRVGAFQVGFQEGLARCAQLLDEPLPLTPLFGTVADQRTEGNAAFGFGDDELFGFLVPDLNLLYDNDLDAQFPNFEPITLEPVSSIDEVDCAVPFGLFELGVELCAETNTVYLNEPVARERYVIGDFAPGYLLGIVWAEAAQQSNDSTVTGEQRQLRNDCLVGSWVRSVIPVIDANGLPVLDENGFITLPEPRDPGRDARASPNDLTEALQMAILIGDPTNDTDVLGSAFEKISAFRLGTLQGIDACF